ncbi:MAG: copper homeostasis protein CutC [Bacteroidetes bacterium]|nr:copper homeostasis protein CutC [Bacteroidota bacterium]
MPASNHHSSASPLGYSAPPLLEIAVFSFESALIAQQSGADRIELCENPADGGTTPSYGYLKKAIEKIQIPVFPIIRPRGGDFLYSDTEWDIVLNDIRLCKDLGFSGIVTGSLHRDGLVNEAQLKQAVSLAYPMEVTFHRAFDRVSDPLIALEQVIAAGCTRILTSGLHPEVMAGTPLLKQLVQQAGNRMVIMPGSGVRSSNLHQLRAVTGAREFHSSARLLVPSRMNSLNPTMQENLENISVDAAEISRMKQIVSTPGF